jgi:CDP-paratose 2-epimerase
VAAYRLAVENAGRVAGRAFNLGGGPANAVSLQQVLRQIERIAGGDLDLSRSGWRAGDQLYFVADTRRLRHALGWRARVSWRDGLADLASWLRGNARAPRLVEAAAERRVGA